MTEPLKQSDLSTDPVTVSVDTDEGARNVPLVPGERLTLQSFAGPSTWQIVGLYLDAGTVLLQGVEGMTMDPHGAVRVTPQHNQTIEMQHAATNILLQQPESSS